MTRRIALASVPLVALLTGCLSVAAPSPSTTRGEAERPPIAACADLPFGDCRMLANFAQSEPGELLLEVPAMGPENDDDPTLWLSPVGAMATSLDPVFAREWQRPF